MEPTISRTLRVSAPPAVLWPLVSDLTRMGEFSPENAGGRWKDGSGPAVGATFLGVNRNGRRRWATRARVLVCEPEHRFVFEVRTALGTRTARWEYELTTTPDGTRLTENWYRVGGRLVRHVLGPWVTGRKDRPGFNAYSIEHTLAAIKACAERGGRAEAVSR